MRTIRPVGGPPSGSPGRAVNMSFGARSKYSEPTAAEVRFRMLEISGASPVVPLRCEVVWVPVTSYSKSCRSRISKLTRCRWIG